MLYLPLSSIVAVWLAFRHVRLGVVAAISFIPALAHGYITVQILFGGTAFPAAMVHMFLISSSILSALSAVVVASATSRKFSDRDDARRGKHTI